MLLCPTRDTSPHYLATRVYIASDSLAERHACAKIKEKKARAGHGYDFRAVVPK